MPDTITVYDAAGRAVTIPRADLPSRVQTWQPRKREDKRNGR